MDGSMLESQPPNVGAAQQEPRLLARHLRASAGEVQLATQMVGKLVSTCFRSRFIESYYAQSPWKDARAKEAAARAKQMAKVVYD